MATGRPLGAGHCFVPRKRADRKGTAKLVPCRHVGDEDRVGGCAPNRGTQAQPGTTDPMRPHVRCRRNLPDPASIKGIKTFGTRGTKIRLPAGRRDCALHKTLT